MSDSIVAVRHLGSGTWHRKLKTVEWTRCGLWNFDPSTACRPSEVPRAEPVCRSRACAGQTQDHWKRS